MTEFLLLQLLILLSLIHPIYFFLNYPSLVHLYGDEAPNLVQTVDLLFRFDIVILEP